MPKEVASPVQFGIAGLILGTLLGVFIATGIGLRSYNNAARYQDLNDSDDETENVSDKGVVMEECKLMLVVRSDLKMSKGKAAAQCSHAAVSCYQSAVRHHPDLVNAWERYGQAKICVKVDSEMELLQLREHALALGITAKVIQDAGRTEVEPGTLTVLGIGPARKSVVDKVTSHLKLLT